MDVEDIEAAESVEFEQREVEASPRGVAFMDLRAGQCRWPLGNIMDLRAPVAEFFCGEPAQPGSPYCPDCRRRAYLAKRPHTVAAKPMARP